MKIYTRTGDDGTTGLFGGPRRSKDDLRVDAYGTVDEANAAIGVARAAGLPDDMEQMLTRVQSDLFIIGAELACAPGHESKLRLALIDDEDATRLEAAIDKFGENLPELKSFIMPGGTQASAALHAARCVARRSERAVVAAGREEAIRSAVIVYLNRLSDLLFTLARAANHRAGAADVVWAGRHG
jgi:cob(I)alamin adenosyltransferase